MSEESTALSTRMQERGTSALDAAEQVRKKKKGEQFVGLVERLLERLERIESTRGILAIQEEHTQRQIAAIRAGEFTAVGGELLFNDAELNKTQIIRGQTVIGLE